MGLTPLLSFAEVLSRLHESVPGRLIAVDGLPCAGKSTLAEQLSAVLGIEVLSIDDFVLPGDARPPGIVPAFPFPFFRVDEFHRVVRALAEGSSARFQPYDWQTRRTSSETREVQGRFIVEGCSVLSPDLAPFFDVRIFVESDEETLVSAQSARDSDLDAAAWRDLYLPSVALYMRVEPQGRAHYLVSGRGIASRP